MRGQSSSRQSVMQQGDFLWSASVEERVEDSMSHTPSLESAQLRSGQVRSAQVSFILPDHLPHHTH
jgi:hypothetical protein